jgi:hypothetical protein
MIYRLGFLDLAPPLSHSSPASVSKLSLFLSLPVLRRVNLLMGVGELEANHSTARKLVLCKSFNTLLT